VATKNLRTRTSIEVLAEGYLDESEVLEEGAVESSLFYVDQDTGIMYIRVPGVDGAEDTWASQGGIVNTYADDPEDIGTTAPGTAGELAARGDHVHGHGDQTALPDAHHPMEHDHTGLEGTVSHGDLTDIEADDHHGHPLDNLVATTDPTSTDDSSAGYEVLSRWVNTETNTIWVCASAAASAAVWNTAGPGADGADGAEWFVGATATGGDDGDLFLIDS
jgi:hypothetical protein